jgi:hypothetical protein
LTAGVPETDSWVEKPYAIIELSDAAIRAQSPSRSSMFSSDAEVAPVVLSLRSYLQEGQQIVGWLRPAKKKPTPDMSRISNEEKGTEFCDAVNVAIPRASGIASAAPVPRAAV